MLQDLVLPLGQVGWSPPAPGFLTDWEILPPVRAGRHTITVHRDECFLDPGETFENTPNYSASAGRPTRQSFVPGHGTCPIRIWRFEAVSRELVATEVVDPNTGQNVIQEILVPLPGIEETQFSAHTPIAVSSGLVFDHQVEDYEYTPNFQNLPAIVTLRFTYEPVIEREVIVDALCTCNHYQAVHYGVPNDGEYPCTHCDCERFELKPKYTSPKLVIVGKEEPPEGGFPWSQVNSKTVPWSNR